LTTQLETWANSQAADGIIDAKAVKKRLIEISPPGVAQLTQEFSKKRRMIRREKSINNPSS